MQKMSWAEKEVTHNLRTQISKFIVFALGSSESTDLDGENEDRTGDNNNTDWDGQVSHLLKSPPLSPSSPQELIT